MADDRIDGVVLASPAAAHADQLLCALVAGKTTLVEKPLCISDDGLERITAAASADGAPQVMIAENYYYKPSLRILREMVCSGQIGRVRSLAIRKQRTQQPRGWRSSLGSLLEGGIHFVALLGDLADAALAASTCGIPQIRTPSALEVYFPSLDSSEDPERRVELGLTYNEGLTASLKYAWDVPSLTKGTFQHSRITGDEGVIIFESNGLYIWLNGRRRRLAFTGGDLLGYKRMTNDFTRCLEQGTTPYSDMERGRRDMNIVFQAYRQGHGGSALDG